MTPPMTPPRPSEQKICELPAKDTQKAELPAQQCPELPPRPQERPVQTTSQIPMTYHPEDESPGQPSPLGEYQPPLRLDSQRESGESDITSPIHYTRDSRKLVGYLVPFPEPRLANTHPDAIPQRYLIYTPPRPPFVDAPKEGEKEGKVHKAQRKWQEEIREAKTTDVKTMSWKGVKGKAVRGINIGMGMTKTSNIEFLNRIGGNTQEGHTEGPAGDEETKVQRSKEEVKLEEMLLVYPSSMPGYPEEIREEFINTMMRSKSKAERDCVIATGLLPVSAAIDILITFIWPFGGLLEIDAVWAYSSIRGAKNSRSLTKRLSSTNQNEDDKLRLNFKPSVRLNILEKYLAAHCHDRDPDLFPYVGSAPSEGEVLEAIGWAPISKTSQGRSWEDEQWEVSEAKDDLKAVMTKGAKEWTKWSKFFKEDPLKAVKK